MSLNKHHRPAGFSTAAAIAICLATLVAVSGCAGQPQTQGLKADPAIVKSLKRYRREYVLAPGDHLEVDVYRNGDVSRAVVIRGDGKISLPLLDEISAAGLTPAELDYLITRKLGTRLRDPEVTVIVSNPTAPMVYFYGEVGVVQPVPLRQARTLAQALAQVGGPTRDAELEDIAIIRLDEEGYLRMFRINDYGNGRINPYLSFQNTPLMADDLVVVPESSRSLAGRFLNDFVIEPLTAVNLILTPYFQYRVVEDVLE